MGLANVSTDSSGVPRYIPMIYQTPDGVIPSFALAAASQALQGEPVFGPGRIEIVIKRTSFSDLRRAARLEGWAALPGIDRHVRELARSRV